MKLFLIFPGAQLKVEPDSNVLINRLNPQRWCNAHVFRDHSLRTTWGANNIDNLRYKELTPMEEIYFEAKLKNV
jgi:hypothetical protein